MRASQKWKDIKKKKSLTRVFLIRKEILRMTREAMQQSRKNFLTKSKCEKEDLKLIARRKEQNSCKIVHESIVLTHSKVLLA